ncbi:MAG: T9SS type A sorting domain-containing protein, partial [Ferruginibacter sp.]
YVPGSLEVITAPGVVLGPQTDANDATDMSYKGINNGKHFVKFFIGNNATNNSGGQLESGEGYTVKFKVKGMAIPASVSNTATAYSHTIVNDIFTDDGTAVIGPSGGPTPVKLTRFSVKLSGVNADLLWVTDFEINSDHYEIERSWDALSFEKVGEIKGKGNSTVKQTYNFADINIGAAQRNGNVVYYRLRIVDTDGKNSHSQVIALRLNGTMAISAYTIYPNPFMDDIKIMITGAEATMADFRIIAINGKEQLRRKIKLENGDNIVVLRDLQQLAIGTYILEINTAGNKYSTKIVKKK